MAGFRPRLWPTVLTVPALLVLLGLGTWQMQRLEWKTALIEARDAALAQPPVALTAATSPEALRFRRGEATGTFMHSRELYLGPRTHAGQPGYHVLTPLRLADGAVLLVNRGWVPADAKDPAKRPEGQAAGEVAVQGVVMALSGPNPFTPDNDPAANRWFWIDLPAMVRAVGEPLLPMVLAADGTAPGGLPVGGQGRPELRNQHLGYALTWYGLAVALGVIYVLFHRRRGG